MSNLVSKILDTNRNSINILLAVIAMALFFNTINSLDSIDAQDINFKMLSFYNYGAFSDPFRPDLISVNGIAPSLVGHFFKWIYSSEISPSYLIGIYLGSMFLMYVVFCFIAQLKIYNSSLIILIYLLVMNLPGIDKWYYYHLDKYFSLLLIFISTYCVISKCNSLFAGLLLIIAIITYPTFSPVCLSVALILLVIQKNRASLLIFCFICLQCLFIKYLLIGDITYLSFDPVEDKSLRGYISFFVQRLGVINFGFPLLVYLLLSIAVMITFRFNARPLNVYDQKSILMVPIFLSISAVIWVVVSSYMQIFGIILPRWQLVEYLLLPSSLIFIGCILYLFLDRCISNLNFSPLMIFNNSLFNIFLMIIAIFLFNPIRRNAFDGSGVITSINSLRGIFEKLESSQNKCIKSADLSPFQQVILRTNFSQKDLMPFSNSMRNPKDVVSIIYYCLKPGSVDLR